MRMKYLLFCLACVLLLSPGVLAGEPEPTWLGLTGLFTLPTAEIGHPGTVMLKFSEIRFMQISQGTKLKDVWFTGGATIALDCHWEVAALWRNEQLHQGWENRAGFPDNFNKAFFLGDVKYQITKPELRKMGIAVGVIDLTGSTRYIDGRSTGRGQRLFLVGTYQWAHMALTEDDRGLGAAIGARWCITPNIDLIGDFSSKPVFVMKFPRSSNHMNFNLGLRLYPQPVPRLHFDLTAVGDGEFEFGFALGYNL